MKIGWNILFLRGGELWQCRAYSTVLCSARTNKKPPRQRTLLCTRREGKKRKKRQTHGRKKIASAQDPVGASNGGG